MENSPQTSESACDIPGKVLSENKNGSLELDKTIPSLTIELSDDDSASPEDSSPSTSQPLRQHPESAIPAEGDGTGDNLGPLPPLDPVLLAALNHPRDKLFVLYVEAEFEKFLSNDTSLRLPLAPPAFPLTLNSYQRLLIHRLADRWRINRELEYIHTLNPGGFSSQQRSGLTGIGGLQQVVVLVKTQQTSKPPDPLPLYVVESPLREGLSETASVCPSDSISDVGGSTDATSEPFQPPVLPQFRILPRASSTSGISTRTSGHRTAESFASTASSPPSLAQGLSRMDLEGDGEPQSTTTNQIRQANWAESPPSSISVGTGASTPLSRRELTLEEREAAYKEARERIFASSSSIVSSSSGGSRHDTQRDREHTIVKSLVPAPRPSSAGSSFSKTSKGKASSTSGSSVRFGLPDSPVSSSYPTPVQHHLVYSTQSNLPSPSFANYAPQQQTFGYQSSAQPVNAPQGFTSNTWNQGEYQPVMNVLLQGNPQVASKMPPNNNYSYFPQYSIAVPQPQQWTNVQPVMQPIPSQLTPQISEYNGPPRMNWNPPSFVVGNGGNTPSTPSSTSGSAPRILLGDKESRGKKSTASSVSSSSRRRDPSKLPRTSSVGDTDSVGQSEFSINDTLDDDLTDDRKSTTGKTHRSSSSSLSSSFLHPSRSKKDWKSNQSDRSDHDRKSQKSQSISSTGSSAFHGPDSPSVFPPSNFGQSINGELMQPSPVYSARPQDFTSVYPGIAPGYYTIQQQPQPVQVAVPVQMQVPIQPQFQQSPSQVGVQNWWPQNTPMAYNAAGQFAPLTASHSPPQFYSSGVMYTQPHAIGTPMPMGNSGIAAGRPANLEERHLEQHNQALRSQTQESDIDLRRPPPKNKELFDPNKPKGGRGKSNIHKAGRAT